MTLLFDVVVPILVIFIMTIVGLDLRFEDFRRIRQYPTILPGTIIGQWLAAMLVAGFLGRWLQLPHAVAGGALLVAAAPVATLSNYYTQLARGHLALAVTTTAISSVLAVVATPLVAAVGFRLFLGQSSAFDLPIAKVMQRTVVGLLLPLCIGMFIRHRAEQWATRWRRLLQALGLVAVVAVLGFVVVSQFEEIRDQFWVFLVASSLFTLATLAIGMVAVPLMTRWEPDRWSLLWGFPARNVAIATLIATAAIGQIAMASFVAVLFATQVLLLVPLALWHGNAARASGRAAKKQRDERGPS